MKKLITAATVIVLGSIALTGFASPYERGDRYNSRAEHRLERMTEHLKLSDEQQQQIKALIDQQIEARKAAKQQMKNKIRAVLTDEQKATFDEMQAARKDKREKRMAMRDGKFCDHHKGTGHHHRHGQDDD